LYLYNQRRQHEQARLRALEELFDPASRHFVERLGIGHGWRCLEVGFGAGGLAAWLADRVAPSGRVLAVDIDPRLLAASTPANLEIRRHDLMADEFSPEETAAFDLVHARAVLEHIPDRRRALQRLINAARPGGWVIVEDIDVAGPVMRATAERYLWPPAARGTYVRFMEALHVVLADGGRDPGYGASLPAALRDAGLDAVGAELHAPIIPGGAEQDCMRLTVEYLRPRLLATGVVDAGGLERFVELTRDSACQYVPLFMVTAWGQRSD
jgi:SAM-dependent methyltransferase